VSSKGDGAGWTSRHTPQEEFATWLAKAKAGDPKAAKEVLSFLKKGASVDTVDLNGETALMKAADAGNTQLVELLLHEGADVNHMSNFGRNSLMKAACKNNHDVLAKLLQAEPELFAKDPSGKNALDWARSSGHQQTTAQLEMAFLKEINKRRTFEFGSAKLRELAAAGVRLVDDNREMAPVMAEALASQNLQHILEVAEMGAKIPRAAWIHAVRDQELNIEEETYFLDVEINTAWTPLTFAVANAELDAVEKLIALGAGLDKETKRGHTPLIWACICGHIDIARMLLFNGASVCFLSKLEGRGGLHHAAFNGQGECAELILDKMQDLALEERQVRLDDYRSNPNSRDKKIAAERDWVPRYREMIDATDKHGMTALHVAESEGQPLTLGILQSAESRAQRREDHVLVEDLKAKRIPCKRGCGAMDRADRIERHQNHTCPKRLVGCVECGGFLRECDMQEHLLDACPKRLTACANSYHGCTNMQPDDEREAHELFKCKKRLVVCRLGCEKKMLFDQRDDHEGDYCVKREIGCAWGCDARFIVEEKRQHQKQQCPFRKVKCTVSCGGMMFAKDLPEHVDFVCTAYCMHGCGKRIGPLDRRVMHEKFVCERRMTSCKETGVTGIMVKDLPHWEQQLCPRRRVPVSLEPNQQVRVEDYDTYVDSEKGRCDRRYVRCRRDYVKKRLKIFNRLTKTWEVAEILAFVPPPSGVEAITASSENAGLDGMVSGAQVVGVPGAFKLRYGDGRIVVQELKDLDTKEVERDGWRCGWIPARDLEAHAQVCPMVPVTCTDGQVVPREKVEEHEVEVAAWREEMSVQSTDNFVVCNDGVKVHKSDVLRYLRDDCGWTMIRCEWGCGKITKRMYMKEHETRGCPKRPVVCRNGCGMTELWAEEQDRHEEDECPRRDVLCVDGCGQMLKAMDLAEHRSQTCALRLIICECGAYMPYAQYTAHRVTQCPEELVQSRLGCGEKVRRAELEYFETYHSKRRFIDCEIGCGKKIFWDEQELHYTCVCTKRRINCCVDPITGLGGCGELMRAEELDSHLKTCPHRILEIHRSKRQLRSWMSDGWTLVACDQTGENALTYAAERGEQQLVQFLCQGTSDIAMTTTNYNIRHSSNPIDHETFAGENALTKACRKGHIEVVWYLIKQGASLNYETKRGRTPLIEAASNNHAEIVEMLMREGVDVVAKNFLQRSAVQWARQMRSKDTQRILEAELLVQKETHEIYIAIANHDYDTMVGLVRHGEEYRLNHPFVLEQEARKIDDMLMGLKQDALSLRKYLGPLEPRVKKLQEELKVKEDAAVARITEADRLVAYCENLEKELADLKQQAMLGLEQVTPGDFNDVMELRKPPREIERVMQCICLLQGAKPDRVRDTKVTSGWKASWWVASLELLKDEGLLHKLRYMNMSKVDRTALKKVRALICERGFVYKGSVDDYGMNVGYPLIEALCKFVLAVELHDRTKAEVAPLLIEEGQQRVLYNTEIVGLWQQRKHVKMMTARLNDLQSQAELAMEDYHKNLNLVDKYKAKLRVAKLLEHREPTGHTPFTWACACGNNEIIKLLLRHGATMGADATHLKMAATAIQRVWKHHHWHQTRPKWSSAYSKQFRLRQFQFTVQLSDLTKKLSMKRKSVRLPLCEALYNGQIDLVDSLLNAKDGRGNACGAHPTKRQFVIPLGPAPRPPHATLVECAVDEEGHVRPLNVLECAKMGQKLYGTLTWAQGIGWTEYDKYAKCVDKAKVLWAEAEAYIAHWKQLKDDKLRIRARVKMETELAGLMEKALMAWQFEECCRLVDQGAAMDHESKEGHTALTMAALHGCSSTNEDDQKVLSVELLINRKYKRPEIDRETRIGHTALTCAAYAEHLPVLEALLDLGCNIDQQTVKKQTALIVAARNGKWNAVRLLLERGADIQLRDHTGRSAIDWARENNYIGVMRMMSAMQAGHLTSGVKARRGVAEELVTCCWGCGFMSAKATEGLKHHEEHECVKRVIKCTLGCPIEAMWACEQVQIRRTKPFVHPPCALPHTLLAPIPLSLSFCPFGLLLTSSSYLSFHRRSTWLMTVQSVSFHAPSIAASPFVSSSSPPTSHMTASGASSHAGKKGVE
jgi:ankyrin repeat protein